MGSEWTGRPYSVAIARIPWIENGGGCKTKKSEEWVARSSLLRGVKAEGKE
jgi:hypothetical protein